MKSGEERNAKGEGKKLQKEDGEVKAADKRGGDERGGEEEKEQGREKRREERRGRGRTCARRGMCWGGHCARNLLYQT